MMTWATINIASGVLVACLAAYLLGAHVHRFNLLERVGFGLMGGASILTIGPIMSRVSLISVSPYDDWSAPLLRVGCAMALIGVWGRLEGFVPSVKLRK